MANLEIKDGAAAQKYLKSTGAGSSADPYIPQHAVTIADGANLDAFSRLRVSEPYGVFESSFQYNLLTLLYNQITATNGTITHEPNYSSAKLTVSTDNASSAALQSKDYHRYIPAKSQLIAMTQVVGAAVANVRKRVGYFDAANGIFLEQNGTTDVAFVRRTSTSGSPVDNRVVQASWNIDTLLGSGPSGITLDLSKASILVVDLQWLGMGRVRIGFDVGGQIVYCHEFKNANVLATPYMTTANLPVRWEITNTAASAGTFMYATCAAVISEGGNSDQMALPFAAASGDVTVTTSRTCLVAMRPAATFNSIVNRAHITAREFGAVAGNNGIYVELLYNPTLTGGSWVAADANSGVEVNLTATYSTGGIPIASILLASSNTNRGTLQHQVSKRLPIVLDHAGANPITVAVVATAFASTSVSRGRLAWDELR